MNKFAIGIAVATLGVTGVAGATNGGFGLNSSSDHHRASVSAEANGPDGIGAPDLDGALGTADELIATAQGAAPGVDDITGLLPAVPTICSTSLPVDVPVPFGAVSSEALGLADQVAAFVNGLPLPVDPSSLPVPDEVAGALAALQAELGCLAGQGGALPAAAPCTINIPGLPGGLPLPAGEFAETVVASINSLSGGAVSTNSDGMIGVHCEAQAPNAGVPALPALPAVPAVPAVPALPALPVDAPPAVQDTLDTVTGTVNEATGGALAPVTGPVGEVLKPVTDAINDTVNELPVSVPALPVPSVDCGGNTGGLLGSLTGVLTGSCK